MMKALSAILTLCFCLCLFDSCQQKRDQQKTTYLPVGESGQVRRFTTIRELETANPDSVFQIDLKDQGLKTIPSIVFSFSNLRELNLEGNEITHIPPSISKLQQLQELNLQENNIEFVSNEIKDLRNLQSVLLTDENENAGSYYSKKRLELAYIYKDLGEFAQYEQIMNDDKHLTASVEEEINAECTSPWGREIPPWEYSRTEIGFVPMKISGQPNGISVESATAITPDLTLKNKRVNVNLAYLVCYNYPGRGVHNAFFGYNASPIGTSTVIADKDFTFNQTFAVNESDEPALKAIPIFNGLGTGNEGVLIKCVVYNVSNKNDQKVTQVFESGKKGLDILNVATPAVSMVSGIADEAIKIIKSNHDNIPIHDVTLGLHFNNNGTDLQLRQGTYIVMNVPRCIEGQPFDFHWSDYQFDRTTGKLKGINDSPIRQNYLVFTITKK